MPTPIPCPAAVLFDLDGTLAETLEDIQRTLNATYAEVGLPAVTDRERVRGWVGRGARSLIAASLGEEEHAPRVEGLLARFRRIYPALAGRHARLVPGAVALLEMLARRGVPVGVATNKPREATHATLAALGVAGRFRAVLTPEDVDERTKPDPAMLVEGARQLGADAGACLLVGDGLADVEGARACGMPVVGVLGGYCDGDALRAAGPDWSVESLGELAARLA